ncbi:MAG: AtpZ/AtpI family protein [Patescibacteria group bacterium]
MKNSWEALGFAWELGYTIAVPIAALGFGGAMLDKKLSTTPLFILIGIIISLTISSISVYRKVKMINK